MWKEMTAEYPAATYKVLLIEDNKGDVLLFRRNMDLAGASYSLDIAHDGEEARKFLDAIRKREKPAPDIIFLDLNLPKVSGKDLLSIIKGDDILKHIPVIVLSSSRLNADIQSAYSLNANCYVEKPFDLKQYQQIIKNLWDYWSVIISHPGKIQ